MQTCVCVIAMNVRTHIIRVCFRKPQSAFLLLCAIELQLMSVCLTRVVLPFHFPTVTVFFLCECDISLTELSLLPIGQIDQFHNLFMNAKTIDKYILLFITCKNILSVFSLFRKIC